MEEKIKEILNIFYRGGTSSSVSVIDQASFFLLLRVIDIEEYSEVIQWDSLKREAKVDTLDHLLRDIVPGFSLLDHNIEKMLKGGYSVKINWRDCLTVMEIIDEMLGDSSTEDVRKISAKIYGKMLEELDLGLMQDQEPTPEFLSDVISEIVSFEQGGRYYLRVYDPCCGIGSLLLNLRGKLVGYHDVKIYGVDISPIMARLCLINLYLNGIEDAEIEHSDALSEQNPFSDRMGNFDIILAHLPFSAKLDQFNLSPSLNEDDTFFEPLLLFLEHIRQMMSNDAIALVVAPERLLTKREGRSFRQDFIKKAMLEGIISLPFGSFHSYKRTPTSLIALTNVHKEFTWFRKWDRTISNYEIIDDWKIRRNQWMNWQEEYEWQREDHNLWFASRQQLEESGGVWNPKYYLNSDRKNIYEIEHPFILGKKKVSRQIHRLEKSRPIDSLGTKSDISKWEHSADPLKLASRLKIPRHIWNLAAQDLVADRTLRTEISDEGTVFYRTNSSNPSNNANAYLSEVRVWLEEYLSQEQYKLFEVFQYSDRPLPIHEAMKLCKSILPTSFGQQEAEQTANILERLGVIEAVHLTFNLQGQTYVDEQEALHTIKGWQLVKRGKGE